MITRIVATDPRPRDLRDDTVVYQVPEKSRAYELLLELLDKEGIHWIEVPYERKAR